MAKKQTKRKEDLEPKKEITGLRQCLESLDTGVEEKKQALRQLAHLGSEEANRVIEDFLFELVMAEAEDLKMWAEMALDEGTCMAAIPKSVEEEERMFKEDVHQSYMESIFDLEFKIQSVEEDIAELEYEQEIVRRLKEKAETEEEKELWQLEEDVFHDLLIRNENRKACWERDLEMDSAMAAEMFAEIEATEPEKEEN